VGCCLGGCVRVLAFTLWRAIVAALLAVLLTRIDTFVEDRHRDSITGRAWRAFDTSGRPRP